FAGFVQPRALPEYYALSDVLVFPTLGDPHGLVVEEAMAAGLPVICTEAAGDIRQRQLEGKTGYIVPPADAGQFAERMLRLANDRELRLTFSSNARQLVANRGHECWAKDFEALVERMLSMPPCRTPASFIAHTAGRGVLAVGGKTGGPPAPVMTA
ncbi:MAG TPA: glycosyltransferase family 4 protein, partial [Candidatus Tectomicrobia bacterium]|nr:glycosyltransferase family 4 protein [Candidatus Tectomicrobia bacterium]